MGRFEQTGDGCNVWMRFTDGRYDLAHFSTSCYAPNKEWPKLNKVREKFKLCYWTIHEKTVKELEQDATQNGKDVQSITEDVTN